MKFRTNKLVQKWTNWLVLNIIYLRTEGIIHPTDECVRWTFLPPGYSLFTFREKIIRYLPPALLGFVKLPCSTWAPRTLVSWPSWLFTLSTTFVSFIYIFCSYSLAQELIRLPSWPGNKKFLQFIQSNRWNLAPWIFLFEKSFLYATKYYTIPLCDI